ncbi:MAG: GntR family transcriptional regulator [Spirochaetes bacterium]|nr:GntR family transcriptional regulator [Spirochaetota bacterium]
MEFRQNEAIYLQIADLACENVLSGAWRPGDRVPSVRELAGETEVNPNTVVRTYAYLQDQGIIQNQRGLGYFVAERAPEVTRELMRRTFVSRDLPRVFRTMDLLGMGMDELRGLHEARGRGNGKEQSS